MFEPESEPEPESETLSRVEPEPDEAFVREENEEEDEDAGTDDGNDGNMIRTDLVNIKGCATYVVLHAMFWYKSCPYSGNCQWADSMSV
jgi:hypothetical protein